jgi:ornithine cyclodeaminase/alanine dehydrogenase-like protein (mu-crystallin family)
MEAKMRFVTAAEVRKALTFPMLVAALETAHRRAKVNILDGMLGTEKELYFARSAVDPGRFMGSKLITSFPANLAGGKLPAVQAVCVLFDGTDGRPLAVIDGTEITYWRTAADSALGAKILAPPTPETLLVVGAGEMSRWLVRSHRAVRPSLRRVLIWNRTPDRAARVAASLAQEGIAAEALIKGALLKPGVHLDLVGGYTPETREADDEAARRARVFVDRRETAFHGVGDILQPIANGAIKESDVLGDMYDLAPGKVAGRLAPTDITFFKNAGGGHLDLMTAEVVYRQVVGAS